MRKKCLAVLLLFTACIFSGCAITDLRSATLPDADISQAKAFYVVWLDGDSRNLHEVIRDQLIDMGFQATAGPRANIPNNVDAVVTYTDRWFWDITNYLIQLNIEIRDPKTLYPLAVGESLRTSMARKDPPDFPARVLTGEFSN